MQDGGNDGVAVSSGEEDDDEPPENMRKSNKSRGKEEAAALTKKGVKNSQKGDKEAALRQKAELEMLLMDDSALRCVMGTT